MVLKQTFCNDLNIATH